MSPTRVLFFDGVCGLCNKTVDFLLTLQSKKSSQIINGDTLFFSTLQGHAAQKWLPSERTENLDTIVLIEDNQVYTRSDAVLRAMRHMPFPWNKAIYLLILPRVLRDFFYDLIAANRYKIFGKKEQCRIPSQDERAYFLD